MSDTGALEVHIGDVVRLRKGHPCGCDQFTVVRLGADIGMRCNQCQRRILLPRSQFERRVKAWVSHAGSIDPFAPEDADPAGTSL